MVGRVIFFAVVSDEIQQVIEFFSSHASRLFAWGGATEPENEFSTSPR